MYYALTIYNTMTECLYNDYEVQMNTKLILCIEECDTETIYSQVDNRMFIGWSTLHNLYFVRGRRDDTRTSNYVPYVCYYNSKKELYNFINFTIGKSKVNIILYNFNNIQQTHLNDITYEFCENNMDNNYEIAGYNECTMKRSEMLRYLRLLKTTTINN
jgi:hypothetical protein